MSEVHISLVAEKLTTVGGIVPITNSLVLSWVVMAFLLVISYLSTRKLSIVPGRLQSSMEIVVSGIHSVFESVLHDKVHTYFPFLATIFLFIMFQNWFGLLPGVGTIGFWETIHEKEVFVPLFRSGTADLNMTLTLALIAMGIIQITGIRTLGMEYVKKFINFSNPINFYVGVLELISEFSKIISFAFRLFGNVFAGEVLLTVITFLVPIIIPLPFYGLELFVGFIQALVFSMLTAVFLSAATSHH